MAGKFILTAQLQLQAPTNTQQVITQMRNQLSGAAKLDVKANIPQRQLAQANKSIQAISASTKEASRSSAEFGRTLGAAARRFGAITIATGTFLALARGIKEGVGAAHTNIGS